VTVSVHECFNMHDVSMILVECLRERHASVSVYEGSVYEGSVYEQSVSDLNEVSMRVYERDTCQ